MNRIKYVLIFIISLMFISCASEEKLEIATQERIEGDRLYSASFQKLPKNLEMHKIISLNNVEVHIVGDIKLFNYEPYRNPDKCVAGYFWYRNGVNEIWVLGRELDNKAVVCKTVLGHEFLNAIVKAKPDDVLSPYKLKEFGG